MNALAENSAGKHIPYRESKLTRVLRNSVSGNSQTTFVGCVSPSLSGYEETLSTLLFLNAAAKVATSPLHSEEVKVKKSAKKEAEKPNEEEGNSNNCLEMPVVLPTVNAEQSQDNLDEAASQKPIEDYPELPILSVGKDMKKAGKIIDQLKHVIRYLKGEVAKKVLGIRNI